MSREIKFRAWDKENNVMLSNQDLDNYDKDGVMHLYDILKDQEKEGVELMQYTGLKDKNGKEVYEGDVVKLDDILCEITYSDGSFQMITSENQGKSGAIQDRLKRFEVIGNVYENPELLIKNQ